MEEGKPSVIEALGALAIAVAFVESGSHVLMRRRCTRALLRFPTGRLLVVGGFDGRSHLEFAGPILRVPPARGLH